jgi:hypothetical protein
VVEVLVSADLLRRAAVKLREHANAANFPDGWAVNLADSEVTTADGGMMIADTMELTGSRPDASYIALMHPPVALALAAALDGAATDADYAEAFPRSEMAIEDGSNLVAVARAVLREPEVTS